ncbi:MAG TPA: protein kinase [Gemmatimonadales bacterium]|nr:protein kinase [Gemmatimonadales bacterium]
MTVLDRACPACHTPLPTEAQFCMHCGKATPTDPGVPPRTMPTGEIEVAKVRRVLGDRYRIERVVGEGGMATVFLAEDVKHHRKVAVKVMRAELAATVGADRFLREVEIAAQLNHPHILPMHDSGEADGLLYYVMPYVEGESLQARLRREAQLPVQDALRLAREVAEALAYAHRRGIIHRDIKPANILISEGHALVADFGIARALGGDGEAITKTGLAVGTPQYMSPEQATGARDVDGRTDVYALGAVLYEMVAGEPPFTGATAQVIIGRSLTQAPAPLTQTRQGLPVGLEAIVSKALAKSPADRHPSAASLAEALSGIETGTRSSASEPALVAPPRGGRVWAVFGTVALAAFGLLAYMAGRWGLPHRVVILAVGLLVAGAAVLALTAAADRRRRAGAPPAALDRWLTWRNAALGGVMALVLWAAAATVLAVRAPASARAGQGGVRVAVLPFQNQGAAEDAYFADGIADEVRGKLARVRGLTVIASTSVDQYRSSTKSSKEIASELQVDYLLLGRVRWAGSAGGQRRVQVVPELVDGKTGATAWQEAFDTDLTDVFEVQSQIATRVAGALGAALGAEEHQQLAERPTANLAAWELYLKGRAIADVGARSQRQAASYFEQAVALDSTFVDAWAALSIAIGRVFYAGSRDPSAAARSKVAMDRALALDPAGPAGHLAASRYYLFVDREPQRADAEAALAFRAAPADPAVLALVASQEVQAGRVESALAKLEQLRELDPRSAVTLRDVQQALVYLHRYPEAISTGEAALRLQPANLRLIQWQVISYVASGDLPGARAVVRSAIAAGVSAPEIAAYFSGYLETSWTLDEPEQLLLFRLTPGAFDDDRAWWGQSLATAYWTRGELALARAYADSALPTSEAQARASPNDPQPMALYAQMLAHTGRRAEATAAIERALALIESRQFETNSSYTRFVATRTYLALGEHEKALDLLERVLKGNFHISPAWLRLDPTFAPLRGNPRFEKLAGGV